MAKKRISNNILNGMLILIIIIIVTVGVYAVAPSVLGHTSDEINVKLPNGTIEKLQQSFSQDLVVRDSTRNVSVNDIYLQSTGTYASTYLKNIRSNVQSIGECSQIEFRTENAGCTCAVGCALVISGLPRCGFCLMDITNVGDLQAIANSIGSIFVGEDVVAHVDISTTTVTYITSDGGYFTLTGTSQQLAALEAEMAGYGIHFSSALEMSSAQLQVLLAKSTVSGES